MAWKGVQALKTARMQVSTMDAANSGIVDLGSLTDEQRQEMQQNEQKIMCRLAHGAQAARSRCNSRRSSSTSPRAPARAVDAVQGGRQDAARCTSQVSLTRLHSAAGARTSVKRLKDEMDRVGISGKNFTEALMSLEKQHIVTLSNERRLVTRTHLRN